MRIDADSQLFLLLAWVATIFALVASLWLFKDVRHAAEKFRDAAPAATPLAIPREAVSTPRRNGFEVPPPPFFITPSGTER